MSVFDFINEGRYENKVPYRTDNVPVDEETMTVREAREHKEAQAQRRREQRDLCNAEGRRLRDLFKADLEDEYGVKGHAKADKLFELAWEQGHSGGYHDVACSYADMAELLNP